MHNSNDQHMATTGPKDDVPMFMSPWTPDTLITDELLDSYNIPPGNKGDRLNNFYKNSEILYNYMCYYIGSERIVKLRRGLVQKKLLTNIVYGATCEIRGSRAEGLDMKGSDTDIMFMLDNFGAAYEKTGVSTPTGYTTRIQYKSLSMSPGYVLVEFLTVGRCISFSSSLLKQLLIEPIKRLKLIYKTQPHGPSLTFSYAGEDIDVVPTLRTEKWPEIATEWILRERKFGWPSQEMINYIVMQGCGIVPVGCKANKDNDKEWRLSFSLAEKVLIFSFNHTQLLVYGLLKLILKEIVKPEIEVSELLCSYFIKTTLFWVIEETHASIWKPQLIILCFYKCLERLIQFITEDNCPNYFIRINNMFAGRISISGKEKLLQLFRDMSEKGLNWTLKCETMNKLSYCIKDPSKLFQFNLLRKEKDLMEIIGYALDLIRCSKYLSFGALQSRKNFNIRWLKSLLKIPIVKTPLREAVCHFMDAHRIVKDNKIGYCLQKLHLFLLCLGCNTDLTSGKLTLASWLYNNKKFSESLEFADLALQFSQYRIFHAGKHTTTELAHHFIPKADGAAEVDLFQTLHRLTTTDVLFCYNSCLLPNEFSAIVNPITRCWTDISKTYSIFSFLPEYYSHFLRSLCLYKLGNINRSHEALVEMQRVKPIGSKFEQMIHSLFILLLRISAYMVIKKRIHGDITQVV